MEEEATSVLQRKLVHPEFEISAEVIKALFGPRALSAVIKIQHTQGFLDDKVVIAQVDLDNFDQNGDNRSEDLIDKYTAQCLNLELDSRTSYSVHHIVNQPGHKPLQIYLGIVKNILLKIKHALFNFKLYKRVIKTVSFREPKIS